MTKRKLTCTEQAKNEAKTWLLKILKSKNNKKLYTSVKHVSKSGMTRNIAVYAIYDNEIINVSYYAAKLLGWSMAKNDNSVRVGGCGMDMGFHLVYTISRVLYKDKKGKKSDAGYILNQRWI